MPRINESELILTPEGRVYHLNLLPHQLAPTIITVGDPSRVEYVSRNFDSVQHRVQHRELITHTGYLNNKPLTVLSTGMGTDNIDIVMNELDALVNIDFASRTVKDEHTRLDIIRLGTSGSVSEEVAVDSIIMSETAFGMDGLLNYYDYESTVQEIVYLEAFSNYLLPYFDGAKPYIATADEELLSRFEQLYPKGATVTACGFYAPQGRALRLQPAFPALIDVLNKFRHKHFRITNLEMETAGIYGMGKLLGHRCLSVNAILANRISHTFSRHPHRVIDTMIEQALEVVSKWG